MNRGNLLGMAMAYAQGLKVSEVGRTVIDSMIQAAADETAFLTACLSTNKKFNSEASTGTYSLSTIDSRFCVIGKSGLYWNQGTSSADYKQLFAVTTKWLDENIRDWRDRSADSPQYFAQDDDSLIVVPKPISTVTDAFWLYYGIKAHNMTDDAQFPFYGTTERSRLSILDIAMCLHFRWQALIILNKGEDQVITARKDYENEIARVTGLLARNLALQNDWQRMKFGGPKVQ